MDARRNRILLTLALIVPFLVMPATAQKAPPDRVTLDVEVKLPPPAAEILGFAHDAAAPLEPGESVTFTAEAVVPEGGYLVIEAANGNWKERMRAEGDGTYVAVAQVPQLSPGNYAVQVRLLGVETKVDPVRASAPVRVAKPPTPPPPPLPPTGTTACAELPAKLAQLPVRFPFDEANPTAQTARNLEQIANLLKDLNDPAARLTITGHCDKRGEAAYNKTLGMERAEYALEYLANKGVLIPQRINAASAGFDRPIDPRDTEEAYAKNRRVEFGLDCGN